MNKITIELTVIDDGNRERLEREREAKEADLDRSARKILSLITEQKAGNKSPKLSKKIKKAVDKYNDNMSAVIYRVCADQPPCMFPFGRKYKGDLAGDI